MRSLFSNLVSAVKGKVNEAGEAVVDKNAVTIAEQAIREDEANIHRAKVELTKLKAEAIAMERKLKTVEQDEQDYRNKAKQLLAAGNEELAKATAGRVVELAKEKQELSEQIAPLNSQINKINQMITQRTKAIEENKREIQKAKTYERLQETQHSLKNTVSSAHTGNQRAQAAMDRVKKRQQQRENQIDAEDWLAEVEQGSNLDNQIDQALGGGTSEVDDLLAQLANEDKK